MRAYTQNVNVAGAAARKRNTFDFLRGSWMLRIYVGREPIYVTYTFTRLTIAKYRQLRSLRIAICEHYWEQYCRGKERGRIDEGQTPRVMAYRSKIEYK